MATGGPGGYSKSSTEPRTRSTWQRTASASDKDDNVSLNSIPNELRPNNWDFSDWKPSATFDNAKRRKKGNPEREREQSLSQDSPPPSERQQRTPSTFPRTRITPSTPTSQRVALERLRQQLTFSDLDDASNEGERNNEKNIQIRRGRPTNYQRQDMSDDARRPTEDSRQDRGMANSLQDVPDGGQIVGRLMQIREYIKQANSMMVALQKSGNPHDLRKSSQLLQVVTSLRDQEQSFMDILQKLWQAHKEDFGKLRKLADNLQEQERSYMDLLQQLLSLKEDAGQVDDNDGREVIPSGLLEMMEDTQSLDLDVKSETSDATTELSQNSANRPRIEDKLGLDSAEEDEDEEGIEEIGLGRDRSGGSDTMDNTVIQRQDISAVADWDYELLNNEGDGDIGESREKELIALKQQQDLLRKLEQQQQQMRALRGKQQSLLALQRDAEKKLAEARARDNQAAAVMKSTITDLRQGFTSNSNASPRQTNVEDWQERSDTASDGVPPELQEIRQRLNYLRNELKDQKPRVEERQNNMEAEAAAMTLDDNRRQLQEKLKDLQDKKHTMDHLLQELQGLRSQRFEELLNNGLEPAGVQPTVDPTPQTRTSSQTAQSHGMAALDIADRTANDANELIDMLDAREKLKKLQEVKARLNQLRSLISYYDSANASGNPPDVDEQTAFRNFLEYGDTAPPRNNRPTREPLQEISRPEVPRSHPTERIVPIELETKSDDDNLSNSDSSETESKLSSLGPWGDDPEIQEKVRKLKEAKDKLKQLQDLVTVVQQSPDAARALPDNLADLAASLEDNDSVAQMDDKNVSVSEGEIPITQVERDSFYEAKMQEQVRELDQLKDERNRLLTIQQRLLSLHDRFSMPKEDEDLEDNEEEKDVTLTKKKVEEAEEEEEEGGSDRRPPVVTFSSNDEVYNKMRKQRIIREELRSKKRELEAIMKKDNKKHYSKNQDNQSDTVSFSTADAFGVSASADATMATWGGSTVDNLESITEDGNPEGNDAEDDDAYPSDGIVQVEEEEEENDYDNETYTIEDDVRQTVQARSLRRPTSETTARPKKRQTYPRPKRETKGGARPKQAWTKYGKKDNRIRQENYRSAEQIMQDDEDDGRQNRSSYEALQQQLQRTSKLCQTLMRDQQSSTGLVQSGYNFGHMSPDMLQQSLQHQQLLMSLNQCYQQMSMQQMEIQNMQRKMQSWQDYEQRNNSISGIGDDLRLRSFSSLPMPGDSRGLSPNVGLFQRPDSFNIQPHFPNDFHSMRNSSGNLVVGATPGDDSVFDVDRQNSQINKKSQSSSGTRKKSGSTNQFLKSDSQTQIGKKPSPSGSGRNLSQRSRQKQEYEDSVPPLNVQDIIRKKRKQNNSLPKNWSTQSLSSQVPCGVDTAGIASTLHQRVLANSTLYRPGLSAGISGAGFQDNSSVTSNQSSRPRADNEDDKDTGDVGDSGDLSLFNALREKIYGEVATLISQNENRPHFLIELFCELQRLTSDYLRQRVLYCIRDVISKYLSEENRVPSVDAEAPSWINPVVTASELTPSESAITSDDEEVKYKVKSKVAEKKAALLRGGSLQDDQFDYVENADNDSSLSTPSNSYWDNPFAQDALGDTVINLNQALRKMREQESLQANEASETGLKNLRETDQPSRAISEPTSSSAVDAGSESDVSSLNNPKIDTQQLDQQIKGIMTEVIPVIKEHMDNVCSSQLLAYIKRLVLSLTRQRDTTQYARFFHTQMGSALQDTLTKFEGRKMRECGEDLLVDMSEVLFNELAFFRLMEDIGEPLSTDKLCTSATQTQDIDDFADEDGDGDDQSDESDTTESTVTDEDAEAANTSMRITRNEEEELGKARDDEFASEVQIQDDDKDEDTESSPYKSSAVQIELAVSETKPFTRIGSDEDDEDADESLSADDQPSETAVSRDAMMEKSSALDQDDGTTTDTLSEKEQPIVDNTEGDADQGAFSNTTSVTNKDVQVNGINGEILENGEDLTIEDLPATLNVHAQEELQKKFTEEQKNNQPINAILQNNNNNNNNSTEELAGDGEFLKEPEDVVSG